jgi:hypothetical protein
MSTPAPGQMILYDDITPPLVDNSYRMTLQTNVTIDGTSQPLDSKQAFFNIEGPRFRLDPSDIASVVPPRNGHGPFTEVVPHIAMYRRTLPWERKINLEGQPAPSPPNTNSDLPPLDPNGLPWLTLLLLEEGEYTLLQNQPLEQVLPSDVFQLMDRPQGTCDAIELRSDLLSSIMPSQEELQLLAHVRQVNIDDRELDVGSKDGFFSVIVANRLPSPGSKCRACLVSLEGRLDLVPKEPPDQTPGLASILEFDYTVDILTPGVAVPHAPAAAPDAPAAAVPPPAIAHRAAAAPIPSAVIAPGILITPIQFISMTRLVLLHSWQYETIGDNNFRSLMQNLDVGLIGKVKDTGHPPITDSAHIKIDVTGRAGTVEQAWYRGPLVPFQLTRDPLGPYHSADQCRRATPETGAEDVSYAAAFEVGRLLAAADPRLAQELMRWRREAYKQSSRADSVVLVQASLAVTAIDLHAPVAPVLSVNAAARAVKGIGPVADTFSFNKIGRVVGLDPTAVQQAFQLKTPAEAVALLGGDAGALGLPVAPVPQTTRPNTTIDQVAADTASFDRLNLERDRLIVNTAVKLGRLEQKK